MRRYLVTAFGQWWGADPSIREEVDVDLVAANPERRSILFGECKWRNSFNETEVIETLEHRSDLVRGTWHERFYLVCSKRRTGSGTRTKAESRSDLMLVAAEDLLLE